MNECESCSKEKATALSYPILGEENNLLSSNTGPPLFGKTSHPTAQSTVFHELPASPASGCQERWLKCRCLRPTHRPADLGPGKPASVTFQVILGSWPFTSCCGQCWAQLRLQAPKVKILQAAWGEQVPGLFWVPCSVCKGSSKVPGKVNTEAQNPASIPRCWTRAVFRMVFCSTSGTRVIKSKWGQSSSWSRPG